MGDRNGGSSGDPFGTSSYGTQKGPASQAAKRHDKLPTLGEGKGTITSVNTVLVEGDDINDPVGDTVRSIVDGHVSLCNGASL